jgi:hypothetical protein
MEIAVDEDYLVPGQRLGEGEFPARLDRVNWTLIFWGGLWVFYYGAWSWLALVLGLNIAAVALYLFVLSGGASAPVFLVASVIYVLASYTLLIVLAKRANRHVWERERRRVKRQSDESLPRLAQLVSEYVRGQRRWAWIGFAMLSLSTVSTLWNTRATPGFVANLMGDLASVLVLLGLYAWERLRLSAQS